MMSAASGEWRDQTHRSRRIGLRPCDARNCRQRGRACGQMQKISAGKFHFEPPSHHSITSSARASTLAGISRPSALAVLRLITSSYLVGGLFAFENAIDVTGRTSVPVDLVRT